MTDKFVGIQIGAVSFVDEGIEEVLDILQERGAINALMLASFTLTRGTGGRQLPSQPGFDFVIRDQSLLFRITFQIIEPGSKVALHLLISGKAGGFSVNGRPMPRLCILLEP